MRWLHFFHVHFFGSVCCLLWVFLEFKTVFCVFMVISLLCFLCCAFSVVWAHLFFVVVLALLFGVTRWGNFFVRLGRSLTRRVYWFWKTPRARCDQIFIYRGPNSCVGSISMLWPPKAFLKHCCPPWDGGIFHVYFFDRYVVCFMYFLNSNRILMSPWYFLYLLEAFHFGCFCCVVSVVWGHSVRQVALWPCAAITRLSLCWCC